MVISASFLDSAQKTKCSAGARLPIFGSSGILILKRKSLNPELEWSCQLLILVSLVATEFCFQSKRPLFLFWFSLRRIGCERRVRTHRKITAEPQIGCNRERVRHHRQHQRFHTDSQPSGFACPVCLVLSGYGLSMFACSASPNFCL